MQTETEITPATVREHRPDSALVLIVDDEEPNRALLRDLLEGLGYETREAIDGAQALAMVAQRAPDLILLDVMMPGMDGFQVCRRLKQAPDTAPIPIIMVTALSERPERILGIQAGANDLLTKPVDTQDLSLRVRNALHTKGLYDQLRAEQQKSEELLLNTLPGPIANRLKHGELTIADHHPEASLLVADLVGFSTLMNVVGPNEVVSLLNEIFTAFDLLVEELQLEKIKTVGDAYIVAAGIVHLPSKNPARQLAELAIRMQARIAEMNEQYNTSLRMRMAITTGSVVAGVIGRKKFAFDVWGNPVNLAWSMASACPPGGIQVDEATYSHLKSNYSFSEPFPLFLKNCASTTGRTLLLSVSGTPDTVFRALETDEVFAGT